MIQQTVGIWYMVRLGKLDTGNMGDVISTSLWSVETVTQSVDDEGV